MKPNRLRGRNDFQRVYRLGKRYEGSVMTAFVLPNGLLDHRLGITASRKAVGNAVKRTRSRRVIREIFRLSSDRLASLQNRYDVVLNANRRLLTSPFAESLEEFGKIVSRMAHEETTGQRALGK